MRKDKQKAIELRQLGKSYKNIQNELGIPIGTLSGWFKNVTWSQEIKQRLSAEVSLTNHRALESMVKANKERWKKKYEEYQREAVQEFEKLKNDPLFLAGMMLYWGEGEKQKKSSFVRICNSEPAMLKIIYLFFIKTLKIPPEKIHAWLLLYPDLVDSVQKNFWSKTSGIPQDCFKKSIYIKGRSPRKRLSYGVCTIFISSRALKERMLKWIELYQNNLQSLALFY
ncbi:MAG: hypothetical protein AAB784_02895 [Patescibacteria group bacterium]